MTIPFLMESGWRAESPDPRTISLFQFYFLNFNFRAFLERARRFQVDTPELDSVLDTGPSFYPVNGSETVCSSK